MKEIPFQRCFLLFHGVETEDGEAALVEDASFSGMRGSQK